MKRMNKLTKRNKGIVIGIAVVILIAVFFVVSALNNKEAPSPVLVFKDNIIFEYGQTNLEDALPEGFDLIEIEDLIDKEASTYDEVSFQVIAAEGEYVDAMFREIPTLEVGDGFEVPVYARLGDVVEEFELVYSVKDTNNPVVEGTLDTTLEYEEGEVIEYDFSEGIKAYDIVDGELEVEINDNNVDIKTNGEYEVIVKAKDKNNNTTEDSFKVTVIVNEKPEVAVVTPKPSSPSKPSTGSTNNTTKPSGNTGGGSTSGGLQSGGSSSGSNTTKPTESNAVCPGGKDESKPCDAWGRWADPVNGYLTYEYYESMDVCKVEGKKVYDSLKRDLIDGKDVVRWSCTELGDNGGTGSFYALRLIHNGDSGQWYLNTNHKWVQ